VNDSTNFDIDVTYVVAAPRDRVYRAFTDADQLAGWYGPPGFPLDRESVEVDARAGGTMSFTMVGEDDPSMRTGTKGQFTEVAEGEVLEWTQEWHGIPGQDGTWSNLMRVELAESDADEGGDGDGATRVVVREGPHPPGTADMGRQAWELMLSKLDAFLQG
jgi:uncharacterized protein YndB with AHSA1/START domain